MSWISGSGSLRPNGSGTSTSASSGVGSPSGAREQPDDQLRHQRLRALARAAELDHEQPVVRVHHRRQRAALAERLHVAQGCSSREFGHGHVGTRWFPGRSVASANKIHPTGPAGENPDPPARPRSRSAPDILTSRISLVIFMHGHCAVWCRQGWWTGHAESSTPGPHDGGGDMDLQLTGVHHVSALSADIAATHDFYVAGAGDAAAHHDGEPGRPDDVPPLLRRRRGPRARR
jgi:hypothetical protein